MRHHQPAQEESPWLLFDSEMIQIAREGMRHYEQVLEMAKGELSPEKWTLAHQTMQQVKGKLQIMSQSQDGVSLPLDYNERLTLDLAMHFYAQEWQASPLSFQRAHALNLCQQIRDFCAGVPLRKGE